MITYESISEVARRCAAAPRDELDAQIIAAAQAMVAQQRIGVAQRADVVNTWLSALFHALATEHGIELPLRRMDALRLRACRAVGDAAGGEAWLAEARRRARDPRSQDDGQRRMN